MKRGGGGREDERGERHPQAEFSLVQCDRMRRVPAALWHRFCRRDAEPSSVFLELVFSGGGGWAGVREVCSPLVALCGLHVSVGGLLSSFMLTEQRRGHKLCRSPERFLNLNIIVVKNTERLCPQSTRHQTYDIHCAK